jgi:putative glutamine amidotransferase
MPPLPLVGIPADLRQTRAGPFHTVGDQYVRAVCDGAGALPLVLPALGGWYDVRDMLARLDGLLFTGAYSNVHPDRYGGPAPRDGTAFDPDRDATTLPLLRAAFAAGVPVLAICRGFQELNVALGGTLYQHVHEVPGRMDHRAPADVPLDQEYGPAHPVRLTPGGMLAGIVGATEITVNSVHWQGVDRLAPSLVVEAVAPDGQVEAVRVADARAFAIGVQWHPEWRFAERPADHALLRAFGTAVAERASRRP